MRRSPRSQTSTRTIPSSNLSRYLIYFFSSLNDQRVFYRRCAVYKSVAEEVTVWGSPLRTAGLLPHALAAQHLTILLGS
uniref:Uncharacterized protein n=1 Tax=Oryza punctata TaxID=4537 RepID=A0A0E0JPT2_ORYPU